MSVPIGIGTNVVAQLSLLDKHLLASCNKPNLTAFIFLQLD